MSAITGIVSFDGRPAERLLLERMAAAGAAYGPDVAGEWLDGSAGFAYRGASTAATAGGEQQPYQDPASGLVAVLDGRVHAREELRAACAASGCGPCTGSDAELVLRAYQTWGESCAEHILGEYAFAIWEPARRRLVCGRDPAGVRPLFYTRAPDGSFRFATVASQLLSDPNLPRAADVPGMIDYLQTRGSGEPERTPCRGIRRLPAGHTLVADDRGVRTHGYWSLDAELDRAIAGGGDHVAACAAALAAAVRDRVSEPAPVGISLSGGHDSSALYVLWQWLREQGEPLAPPRVSSYYWRYPETDEREVVQELLQRWPAEASFFDLTGQDVLAGLEEHTRQLGMPEPGFGWRWGRQQGAALRQAGIRTVVTGDEGNTVAQASPLRAADLAMHGRLGAALAQTKRWSQECREPLGATVSYLANRALHLALPGPSAAIGRLRRRFREPAPWPFYLANPPAGVRSARRVPWARSLADVDQRTGLATDMARLFLLPTPSRDLEGVMISAPYLDRRVIVAFLAALASERGARHSRALLEATVRRTTGYAIRGRLAYADRPVIAALRGEMQAGNSLFSAAALIELGVVERARLLDYLAAFAAGRIRLSWELWTLLSLEAWARCWLRDPVRS